MMAESRVPNFPKKSGWNSRRGELSLTTPPISVMKTGLMPPLIDRLTEQEKDLLKLLAQGHTAKSIALSTGLTESSVNERLRSARRKTGAPSSRELARIVATTDDEPYRKNGDKLIGLEPDLAAGHQNQVRTLATGARSLLRDWGLTMIAGITTIATLLTLQSGSPSAGASVDPAAHALAPTAFTRLNTVGDALYVVEGSVVQGDPLHLGTLVIPLEERGLMTMQIEMNCAARKWRPTAISFYNQDGTPRQSTGMRPARGWSTRNVQGIAEYFCAAPR
jgi:DNA-binding CsgD family transcriptional regulator